jgi:hypothetical protein
MVFALVASDLTKFLGLHRLEIYQLHVFKQVKVVVNLLKLTLQKLCDCQSWNSLGRLENCKDSDY